MLDIWRYHGVCLSVSLCTVWRGSCCCKVIYAKISIATCLIVIVILIYSGKYLMQAVWEVCIPIYAEDLSLILVSPSGRMLFGEEPSSNKGKRSSFYILRHGHLHVMRIYIFTFSSETHLWLLSSGWNIILIIWVVKWIISSLWLR